MLVAAAAAAAAGGGVPRATERLARAEQNVGAIGATCARFGCNDYRNQDFNRLADAPTNSMPYPDFLQAVKAKKVRSVEFVQPSGDEAYALLDDADGNLCQKYDPDAVVADGACRLRMGNGWPVEVANSWSSPTWVVRILKNENIPYEWTFNLKIKPQRRDW